MFKLNRTLFSSDREMPLKVATEYGHEMYGMGFSGPLAIGEGTGHRHLYPHLRKERKEQPRLTSWKLTSLSSPGARQFPL
jgi:hypothetical protein